MRTRDDSSKPRASNVERADPSAPSVPAGMPATTGNPGPPAAPRGAWPPWRERRAPVPDSSNFLKGPDRRAQPTRRWSRYALWGGRRRGPRRTEEVEGSFVDQYSTRLFALMIWIGLMNIGDSFFTLLHLQAGGIELNPFAALLLSTGR